MRKAQSPDCRALHVWVNNPARSPSAASHASAAGRTAHETYFLSVVQGTHVRTFYPRVYIMLLMFLHWRWCHNPLLWRRNLKSRAVRWLHLETWPWTWIPGPSHGLVPAPSFVTFCCGHSCHSRVGMSKSHGENVYWKADLARTQEIDRQTTS